MMQFDFRASRLQCVLCVLACVVHSSLVIGYTSGLITVVPEKQYVSKGSNFTAYCSLNSSMTSRSPEELVWCRGYPPFSGFGPADPVPLPTNVQQVINKTTKAITFLNMTREGDYYYCYLSGENDHANTANCHIMVLEPPPKLKNLSCAAYNLHAFYCWWENVDPRNVEEYNVTYENIRSPFDRRSMEACSIQPTPGVPDDYIRRCVPFTNKRHVSVHIRITNPLGTSDTSTQFTFNDAKPLPLDNLQVQDITARSFHVTGGPPPEWDPPPEVGPSAAWSLYGYEVQYAPVGGGDWETVPVVSHELSVTIEGLSPNTLYKVRARTQYLNTWSDWSDVDKEKTNEAAPSGTVKQLRAVEHPSDDDKNSRSLELDWQDLNMDEKGSDSLVYQVEIIDRRSSQVVRGSSTPGTHMFFADISKFRAYAVCVTPGNDVGNGTATNTSIPDLSGRPGTPVNFQWKDFNETDGTLSWEGPEEPNAIITKFIVKWRQMSKPEFNTEEVIREDGERYFTLPLTGLARRERYHFTVCAVSLKDGECGEVASIEGRTGGGLSIPVVYIVVPIAFLLVFVSLICLLRYHTKVKRSLPEPYFVDAVKNTIYGQSAWTFNESQVFITEKESFDTLRTIDDSTQLLGLDRMCSTEGSTSSSDQGIHDMDGHLTSTSSCTRLVPDSDKEKGAVGGLHVVCEDLDKDSNDAVFPEETCSQPSDPTGKGGDAPQRVATPPNSPASCHSSEEEDKLGAVGGAPPEYAKFADRKQLSPGSSEGRPISSASEDSMSYMRVGENDPLPAGTASQDSPTASAPAEAGSPPVKPDIKPEGTGAMNQASAPQTKMDPPGSPQATPHHKNAAPERHLASSDEDLSGYCKQDLTLGVVPSVTSSGVSSMGEDYSRIADSSIGFGIGSGASVPKQEAPVISQPHVPVVDDPYVTVDNLPQIIQLPSPGNTPAPAQASPYTSPYVTSEHAV